MSETTRQRSWAKRILPICGGLCAFTLVFAIACRIAVREIFVGIEQSKTNGLAAVEWPSRFYQLDFDKADASIGRIARTADLRTRSSAFDDCVAKLRGTATAHHGYLEDLRTQSRFREGRSLSTLLSVPSTEFDGALSDLKRIGRIESISQAGEDSGVKLAMSARHLTGAQTNLVRLQKLQFERNRQLRDALALEKEIAQANENLSQAQRDHDALLLTVAQAHIRFTLVEDYRAPLDVNLAEASLQMRNSIVKGANAILLSVEVFVQILFEYGLPVMFWMALLLWPSRLAWRRFKAHRLTTARA